MSYEKCPNCGSSNIYYDYKTQIYYCKNLPTCGFTWGPGKEKRKRDRINIIAEILELLLAGPATKGRILSTVGISYDVLMKYLDQLLRSKLIKVEAVPPRQRTNLEVELNYYITGEGAAALEAIKYLQNILKGLSEE